MEEKLKEMLDKNFNCETRHRDIVVEQIIALLQPQQPTKAGLYGIVTPRQPTKGELIECPEVRILKDEDMVNPQHSDFARHKIQCKLLGSICLEELTHGTDCPHLLWLKAKPLVQPAEGELAPCPVKTCNPDGYFPNRNCEGCDALAYAEAQLAHDKATMPSEDELADFFRHRLRCTPSELARELLKWLKEK